MEAWRSLTFLSLLVSPSRPDQENVIKGAGNMLNPTVIVPLQ
jgi:hypothetical protein